MFAGASFSILTLFFGGYNHEKGRRADADARPAGSPLPRQSQRFRLSVRRREGSGGDAARQPRLLRQHESERPELPHAEDGRHAGGGGSLCGGADAGFHRRGKGLYRQIDEPDPGNLRRARLRPAALGRHRVCQDDHGRGTRRRSLHPRQADLPRQVPALPRHVGQSKGTGTLQRDDGSRACFTV